MKHLEPCTGCGRAGPADNDQEVCRACVVAGRKAGDDKSGVKFGLAIVILIIILTVAIMAHQ